jgi:hypothetical protein
VLQRLAEVKPAIANIIITSANASIFNSARAWFGGAKACLQQPPHPGKLRELLQKV